MMAKTKRFLGFRANASHCDAPACRTDLRVPGSVEVAWARLKRVGTELVYPVAATDFTSLDEDQWVIDPRPEADATTDNPHRRQMIFQCKACRARIAGDQVEYGPKRRARWPLFAEGPPCCSPCGSCCLPSGPYQITVSVPADVFLSQAAKPEVTETFRTSAPTSNMRLSPNGGDYVEWGAMPDPYGGIVRAVFHDDAQILRVAVESATRSVVVLPATAVRAAPRPASFAFCPLLPKS